MRIKELKYWINYSPNCSILNFKDIELQILKWEVGIRIIPILLISKGANSLIIYLRNLTCGGPIDDVTNAMSCEEEHD